MAYPSRAALAGGVIHLEGYATPFPAAPISTGLEISSLPASRRVFGERPVKLIIRKDVTGARTGPSAGRVLLV
jgi:hypothetical protein